MKTTIIVIINDGGLHDVLSNHNIDDIDVDLIVHDLDTPEYDDSGLDPMEQLERLMGTDDYTSIYAVSR